MWQESGHFTITPPPSLNIVCTSTPKSSHSYLMIMRFKLKFAKQISIDRKVGIRYFEVPLISKMALISVNPKLIHLHLEFDARTYTLFFS